MSWSEGKDKVESTTQLFTCSQVKLRRRKSGDSPKLYIFETLFDKKKQTSLHKELSPLTTQEHRKLFPPLFSAGGAEAPVALRLRGCVTACDNGGNCIDSRLELGQGSSENIAAAGFGCTNRNTTAGDFQTSSRGFSLPFKIITRANIIRAGAAALGHPAPCEMTVAAVQLLEKNGTKEVKLTIQCCDSQSLDNFLGEKKKTHEI